MSNVDQVTVTATEAAVEMSQAASQPAAQADHSRAGCTSKERHHEQRSELRRLAKPRTRDANLSSALRLYVLAWAKRGAGS